MATSENLKPSTSADDAITVASIAALAFMFADLAHQGLGHGFGFYFAGGKSSMLTTTRLIEWITLPEPQWRLFDLGGPAGNLVMALAAWLGLRFFRTRPIQLRFFVWLVMAFNLFWAFGYLIFCGVTGRGDWMALIANSQFIILGRILFVLIGIVFYRLIINLVAKELPGIVLPQGPETKMRVSRLIKLSYLFGGLIACAGAAFDPRGVLEIVRSGALSSLGAAVGLLWVPAIFSRLPQTNTVPLEQPISRHLAWILAGAAGSLYFITILGPGILMWFGN